MKPRLSWFSPLPPARSAIGEYSGHLVGELARSWDVDLWTDAHRAAVDGHKIHHFDSRAATLPWSDLNISQVAVYHIGNITKFHGGIFNVLCRHPGILVLHELYLADFVAAACRQPEYHQILGLLDVQFGGRAVEELLAAIEAEDLQSINERFPLYKLFADQATGVVVHSRVAYDEVSTFGGRPCVHLDLPHVSDPITPPRGKSVPDRCNFVSFGHIGRNRLINLVLEALAHFRERDDWKFDVYGEMEEESAVRLAVDALGLTGRVTLHGFIDEAALRRALGSADLAFNLRYPTLGEASFSQLTLWNHAVPTIVSDVGWYADLPKETVYAIDPRRAAVELVRAIASFFAEPARFAEMGRRGKRELETRHSPRTYVERLSEFINAVQSSAGSTHAAESMARTIGRSWREMGLPWRAQGRMLDRCADIINELTGVA
jgi:glycosyltransferase involved in cell wall biosynthesis